MRFVEDGCLRSVELIRDWHGPPYFNVLVELKHDPLGRPCIGGVSKPLAPRRNVVRHVAVQAPEPLVGIGVVQRLLFLMALGAGDDEPVVDLPNKWAPRILHTPYDTIEVWSLSWLYHDCLHTQKLAEVHNSESNVVHYVAVLSTCPPVDEGVPLHVISPILHLCNWLLKARLMPEEHSEELRHGE